MALSGYVPRPQPTPLDHMTFLIPILPVLGTRWSSKARSTSQQSTRSSASCSMGSPRTHWTCRRPPRSSMVTLTRSLQKDCHCKMQLTPVKHRLRLWAPALRAHLTLKTSTLRPTSVRCSISPELLAATGGSLIRLKTWLRSFTAAVAITRNYYKKLQRQKQ